MLLQFLTLCDSQNRKIMQLVKISVLEQLRMIILCLLIAKYSFLLLFSLPITNLKAWYKPSHSGYVVSVGPEIHQCPHLQN